MGSSTAHTIRPGPGPEEKCYDDRDHLESDLRAFFASKSPEFYEKGIRDLVRRWQKVVDVDGDYFVK
ncbi:hypothetical protein RB195_015115 [Necator americanus]|uniref:Uncharacterized protein n=1 Tax=Necator americanus TaxID=51031 RepID=A0ABR1E315_NECAM